MKAKYKHIFGPVPSRRFGRSLGIDLVPFKTCSLDCIFCQLGRTTHKTVTRKPYVPIESVLDEFTDWFNSGGDADYITLSGSGEPTLHSRFGDVLQFIALKTKIPSVLLTNSTLFHLPEVREAAVHADVVKMSLSVWDQTYFQHVNRPHHELDFEKIVDGMRQFRNHYKGQIWIEVFLIAGVNAIPADVQGIAQRIQRIKPDRIHLNTAVRPPAEDFVTALSGRELNQLAPLFHPIAEVIPDFHTDLTEHGQFNENAIVEMLQRRPCTADQIGKAFGMHLNETFKYLGELLKNNQIQVVKKNQNKFYTSVNHVPDRAAYL
ncbi:radical SAM protein [candidate division KSB1 bacterium]|nr:radical SAM protein [candidate division KSB1 bacterium]